MKIFRRMREHFREQREMKQFGVLLRHVEAPFDYDLERLQSKSDALDALIDILVSRKGINYVLRKYEQEGISDQDRLKNLYWKLMAGSHGPTLSGKNVATAAITDPTFLIDLLQVEKSGLNNKEFGIAAWKIAETRWPKPN